MFPPASGPLSSTMWSQVVRVLLGLIHGVRQVHTVDTAHCKISTYIYLLEAFTLLKLLVCVCVFTHTGSGCVKAGPGAAETESPEVNALVWP